jgi:hypothetical protein
MVDPLGIAGLVAASTEAFKKPRPHIARVPWQHLGQGIPEMTFASLMCATSRSVLRFGS